jgi:membrane protein implicated in regulation of membrane protease activity
MGEWLRWMGDHLWAVFAVIAVALAAVEVLTLDLVFLMLAAGALAGAIAAGVTGSFVIAIGASVIVAIGMLAAVRPIALRHLKQVPHTKLGVQALIGSKGIVLERVDAHNGRVKIGGETWSARAYDETSVIEPGKTVDVASIDGATAYVYESEGPWPIGS